MSQSNDNSDEESLKSIFDQAMKLFDKIENDSEPTNSEPVQVSFV